jgi:hypothetical protein
MDPVLRSTLLKLLLPAIGLIAVLAGTRRRGMSWRDDLRLVWPSPRVVLLWMAIWIAWVAASELAIPVFGLDQPSRWPPYPILVIVLRIAAIGLLGPALEEILMRGVVFHLLSRTRLGPWGAIAIAAMAWAAMHAQYGWKTLVLIALDGLVLGIARHRSRSTFVPVAMHMLGNLYSITQSLHG